MKSYVTVFCVIWAGGDVHMHGCAWVLTEVMEESGGFFYLSQPSDKVLHQRLSSQGPACLLSKTLGSQALMAMPSYLPTCWRFEFQSSCFQNMGSYLQSHLFIPNSISSLHIYIFSKQVPCHGMHVEARRQLASRKWFFPSHPRGSVD